MLARSQIQPQASLRVDNSTTLSQYLSGVYVPGVDSNSGTISFGAMDRKGQSHLTTVSGPPNPVKAYGAQGTFYADNGSGFLSGNMIPTITTFPLVMIAAGYFTNGASGWTLASMNSTGGGGGSSRCDIILASSTQIDYTLRNNFGTTATTSATGLSSVTSGAFFICVAQSLAINSHRFYVNGTQFNSTTSIGALTNPYHQFAIGGQSTGGTVTANLNGGVLFAAHGRKDLPDALALELSRSPRLFWNMFPRPQQRYMQMAMAAANNDIFLGQACL